MKIKKCRRCSEEIEDPFRRVFCSEYCARQYGTQKCNVRHHPRKNTPPPPLQLCRRCKRTLGRIRQPGFITQEKHFTDGEKIYTIRLDYSNDPHVHTHYLNGRGIMGLKNAKNQFKLRALRFSKQYVELTAAFDDLVKSIGIDNLNLGKRDVDEYNRFLGIKHIGGHFYGQRIHLYVAKNKIFKFHYFPDGSRKKLLEKEFKDYHWARKEFGKLIYKERTCIINEMYKNENPAGIS